MILLLQLLHHAANQLLGRVERIQNNLQVHGRLVRLARAPAVNPMLPHQDQRVCEQIQGNRQTPSWYTHHEFIFLQIVALIVEQRHKHRIYHGVHSAAFFLRPLARAIILIRMVLTTAPTLPSLSQLESASELVHRLVPPTPQYSWPLLNAHAGCEVWLKHENHTPVGSFKVRGGIIFMDWLRRTHPEAQGVISATRGSHGQSQAFAARHFGFHAVVVAPRGNSREKNAAMRALGAELVEHGDDFHAADHYADDLCRERGLVRMPSFDPLLVQGVATYGLELFRGAPPLDAVFVPIGWGSGACGIAAARNALNLKTRIIGVVSASAPSYALSFAEGRIVEKKSTTRIADGVAIARAHPDAFEILRHELDQVVEVTDDEVEDAMRVIFSDTHNIAEGAGAAALAALLKNRENWRGKRVGVVVSGGNVDREVYARVIAG